MKFFTGWVLAAGLALTASSAQAQMLAPHEIGRSPVIAVSDVGGPYAAMPPEAPRPGYGYGPRLLPPLEVYTVVRENGFSPLGIPRQRGFVYTIAVIDRGGDDGRLVIDARTGQILRFVPANRFSDNFDRDVTVGYGAPAPAPLPPLANIRAVPQPPRPIPHVASRTVPVPKPSPLAARPAAEPAQRSAAVQPKPAAVPVAPAAPTAAATVGESAPSASSVQPTREMPKAQGLE